MKDENDFWGRKEDNKPHADIDLGIVVEHLCLAATDRGLGSCWVCNFEVATTKRLSLQNRHSSREFADKDITDEVVRHLPTLPKTELLNLFIRHTSCALSICENWDPSVREDIYLCEFRNDGGSRRVVATIIE